MPGCTANAPLTVPRLDAVVMQPLPRTSLQLHPLDSCGFNSTWGGSTRRWTAFPNSAEAAELLLCRNRIKELLLLFSTFFFRLRLGTLRSRGDGWHSVGGSHSTNAFALFDCILLLASHRCCMHPLPRQASLSLLSYSTPTPFSLGLRRGLGGLGGPGVWLQGLTRLLSTVVGPMLAAPVEGPATALRRRAFRSVQQPPPRSSASSLLVAVPSLARWLAALSPHACQARSNGRSACLSVPAIVLHAQPYLAEPSPLSPWPLPCRRA